MALASICHDAYGPHGLLANRQQFESHGAMRAYEFALDVTGRLPHRWVEQYRSDTRRPGVSYVVFSYATPIAWERTDGVTVVPDVTYSRTTTRHQNLCRAWME